MKNERVKFAEAMMEEAEHSSEIALRTSLSRAYYAVHQLGLEVTGASNHIEIRNRLRVFDEQLGRDYGHLLDRRVRSDYTPSLQSFEPRGLDTFRETVREDIILARRLLERLKERLS